MSKWLGLSLIVPCLCWSAAYADFLERDPFVSIVDLQEQRSVLQKKRSITISQMKVKGIIWSARAPIAIINDELISQGDKWRGFTVDKIDKQAVSLSDEEGTYLVSMEQKVNDSGGAAAQKYMVPPAMGVPGLGIPQGFNPAQQREAPVPFNTAPEIMNPEDFTQQFAEPQDQAGSQADEESQL
jgi:hypothetical protein